MARPVRSNPRRTVQKKTQKDLNIDAEAKKLQIAEEIMAEVQDVCEIDQKDNFTGRWSLMYVRLRFVAVARIEEA